MDITRPTCSNSRDVFSVETGRKTSQVVRESEGSDGVAVRTFSPGGKISAWKKTRRTVFGLVLGALFSLHFQVLAAGSVTLAWSPSTDPAVAGYNIYYGGAHGVYTNKIAAGTATKVTISGLIQGSTYYIAATTYSPAGLESSYSSELTYLVPGNPPIIVNQAPTLNVINDLPINENTGSQSVGLSGITAGASGESQQLTVTAVSSDTDLIPNPSVNYTSPNATGSLSFRPVANICGTAVITVTVNDGQTLNSTVVRTFTVTVLPSGPDSLLIKPLTNQVGMVGQTITLTATPTSGLLVGGPLTYQWKFNGANLPLAILPTLTLNNLAANQAGLYSVTAVNLSGATCQTAALTVYPTAAARLAPAAHVSGQYALDVAGVTGLKYVVQTSTNLINWVTVQTNTAPFTYVDVNASKYRQRFYRTFYKP